MGIALGLGAQDLVKNLLSGLIILIDRPFQLGDRVRIGEAYGEINHIGISSTKLITPDDTLVSIPNSAAVNGQVFNANAGVPDCQVVTDLFLPPATDPRLALRIGYEAAYTSPYLLPRKPVVALVSDVFDQRPYLRLRVKAYVYDHRYEPRMQSDITVRAKSEFLRLGTLDDWGSLGGGHREPHSEANAD
jgi:small-conductance mechanosensitive channel